MELWTLEPGLAALVTVISPAGIRITATFMSHEKGIYVHDRPLVPGGFPLEVCAALHKHFKTVFDLEHETWPYWKGYSPRARYVDSLQPWDVEVLAPMELFECTPTAKPLPSPAAAGNASEERPPGPARS